MKERAYEAKKARDGIKIRVKIIGNRIKVRRYDEGEDLSAIIKNLFSRFKEGEVEEVRHIRVTSEMSHIHAAILEDVILAEVSEDIGKGKGFGIHELLDQLGAIAGPLLVSVMITLYGYRIAFLSLLAPAFISMSFVTAAYMLYPRLKSVELSPPKISFRGLGRGFTYTSFQ